MESDKQPLLVDAPSIANIERMCNASETKQYPAFYRTAAIT